MNGDGPARSRRPPTRTRKLRLYVRHIREVTPRIVGLVDMLRAAAPADADVAAFLAHMQEGRREGPFALLAPLAQAGQLRPGVTLDAAADATYALASADTFRALVSERGWSWHRAEAWITDQLRHALLPDPGAGNGRPTPPEP